MSLTLTSEMSPERVPKKKLVVAKNSAAGAHPSTLRPFDPSARLRSLRANKLRVAQRELEGRDAPSGLLPPALLLSFPLRSPSFEGQVGRTGRVIFPSTLRETPRYAQGSSGQASSPLRRGFEGQAGQDIRAGRVVGAEDAVTHKPTYCITVNFGPEVGIKKSCGAFRNYEREELLGKLVIALLNFPPKRMGPETSEVLILGASHEKSETIYLTPQSEVPLGCSVF